MSFTVNVNDEQWEYLKHAKVDDKMVVPISLYLELTWKVFKSLKDDTQASIVFKDIQIHKHQVEIPVNKELVLVVMVQKGIWYIFLEKKLHAILLIQN